MSHTVTIRTQTVTTGSSAVFLNTGYFRTWGGILKFLQLALGIICVGIVGNQLDSYRYWYTGDLFFLLITTTFMIGTCILLLSCVCSLSSASLISKSIYEVLYHSIAFGLLLAAGLTVLAQVNRNGRNGKVYELLLGAAICALVNSGLYLFSAIIALRMYRGL